MLLKNIRQLPLAVLLLLTLPILSLAQQKRPPIIFLTRSTDDCQWRIMTGSSTVPPVMRDGILTAHDALWVARFYDVFSRAKIAASVEQVMVQQPCEPKPIVSPPKVTGCIDFEVPYSSTRYRQTLKDLDYRPPRFNRGFWYSASFLVAGNVVDFTSSRGLTERNPILRNSRGQVSGVKFATINAGMFALTLPLQRNHPKIANAVRYVASAFHFGIAIHNQTVK